MKFWNIFVKAGLANGFGKKRKTNTISDSLSLYFRFIPWSMVLEYLNIELDFVHYKAIPKFITNKKCSASLTDSDWYHDPRLLVYSL